MLDLKTVDTVLTQLEEERGIPKEKIFEALELSLASAYKKEYGEKGQVIKAMIDKNTGQTEYFQVKTVVDDSMVEMDEEKEIPEDSEKVRYNQEHHIFIEDAKKIKGNAELGEEIVFPLEEKDDFSRVAAQAAKQTIMQKIREVERASIQSEFGDREGEIVSGTVQRMERGMIFVDLGRTTGIIPYEEQIRNERYNQGDRIRAYLFSVDGDSKGSFIKLSRTHPNFLKKLFEIEVPEITAGTVEIKAIAREPGSRSKVAVVSHDESIDPVGALVGQRGVRVSTITSELGGEKIDIIEWSENIDKFIEDSLSPAKVLSIETNEEEYKAKVAVSEDQQSLAIGKGGQNVRLAAKLTGWKIDIASISFDEKNLDTENIEKLQTDSSKDDKDTVNENEDQKTEENPEKLEGEAEEVEEK